MVSKNNRIKKMEESAERQSHFGIRKLTIGAASVLLGTTLWMGVNANSAHAATEGENANNGQDASTAAQTPHRTETTVKAQDIKKVVVTTNNDKTNTEAPESKDAAVKTSVENDQQAAKPAQATSKEKTVNLQKNSASIVDSTHAASTQTSTTEKSTTFKITNNSSDYSNNDLKNLFTSLAQKGNSSAVDLNNFNPTVNYQNQYSGNSVLSTTIPESQYAFSAAYDKNNRNTSLVWTTDKDNPGQTLYFYVDGRLAATISKSDPRTNGFDVEISNTNDPSFYHGGEYAYDYTHSKNKVGGYNFTYNNVEGLNGTKVNNGISGNVKRSGSNIVFQKLDGSGDLYNTNPSETQWNSVSALAPTKLTQHIYYVNADTGEVMATKDATGLSGQKYDLTDAAPENVAWKGNEYKLVDANQVSDAVKKVVVAENNGVDITAGAIANAPLKGVLGQFRPGDIYAYVLNYGQGVLFIDKGRKPDEQNPVGTTDSNAYEMHISDTLGEGGRITAIGDLKPNGFNGAGGLSSVNFKPGDEVGGAVQGGTAMNKNMFKPGNQDFVFFYKATTKTPDKPVTPPETQKGSVTVVFHDVTDNVDLQGVGSTTGSQEVGTQVTDTSGLDLLKLEGQGYEYVNQTDQVPTTIPNGDKTIVINVKHGVSTSTVGKDVSRTIYYQGKDTTTGTTTPVNGSPDNTTSYTQTAHFTRDVTTDKVTNKVTYGAWKSADNIMAGVPSQAPSIVGYDSVDKPVVASVTVSDPDHKPEDVIVTYTKASKPAVKQVTGEITYIDDTTGHTLQSDNFTPGEVGTDINYSAQPSIDSYEKQGYKLVSNNFGNGKQFKSTDTDPTANNYEVHLAHDTKPETETAQSTAHVHYIISDGKVAAPADSTTQTINWTRTNQVDQVTGKTISEGNWTPSQGAFDDVASPAVTGYTPDHDHVSFDSPVRGKDQVKNVTYYPNPAAPVEKGSLNVIFHDDTDNVNIPGVGTTVPETEVGTQVDYKSQPDLTKLENKGYIYVPTTGDQVPTEITKGNTTVTIHVKHGTRPVTPDKPADPNKPVDPTKPETPTPSNPNLSKNDLEKQITRDVTYVYTDGKKSAQPVHQVVNFKGEGTIDTVTGNLVNLNPDGSIKDQRGSIKWNAESQDFNNIPAIDTTGYKIVGVKSTNSSANVDQTNGSVSAETVTPNSDNIAIQITLSPKAAPVETTNGSITYIDDITGDTLEDANFSGAVGTQIPYTTANRISYYEGKGYKLISNDFKDGSQVFNKDAKKNIFQVHLTHATTPVTPENPGYGYSKTDLDKTITRDVIYQYEDGSQAATPVHQDVHFRGEGTIDKVTGQLVTVDQDGKITGKGQINWTPADGKFDTTKSIDTTQYHITKISEQNTNANVDQTTGVVAGEEVTPNSNNSKVIITLAKNPAPVAKDQVAQVIYRDLDENSRVIAETNDMVGKSDTAINYSSADTIKTLEDKGYVLVNNGYDPDGKAPKFDNDENKKQVFYIDLKHGTRPVTPDKPADPDKPVDPTKPETPTPSNPNLSKKDLDKTITRTIEYRYADGTTAHEPVVQRVEFKGEGTIDTVTGNLVNLNPDGSIKDQRGSIKWNAESQSYADVPAINHDGYYVSNVSGENSSATVNDTEVSSENVTPNSLNGHIVITLTKNPETPVAANGSIKYIDDTTNTTLANGNFSGEVGDKIPYTTADQIASYEKQGYKLVSNNFNDGTQVFDQDPSKNTFEVHLVHDTTPINPEHPGYGYNKTDLDKTITRDVIYQYSDGSQAATPVHQDVHFRGEGTVDKVTGQLVTVDQNGKITGKGQINWTPADGKFDTTKSIDTDKYVITRISEHNTSANVDQTTGVVAGENVTPNSSNSQIVITLDKKQAPVEMTDGSITYIDDVTGQTLQSANFGGQVGTKITYTTADKIASYEKQGYKLVSNDFTDGSQVYNKDAKKNIFTVHLTHTTSPVDPQHPGHGYDKDALDKTITRTIEYVYSDGAKTLAPVTQQVHFEGHGVVDNVTGGLVTIQDGKIIPGGSMTWTVTPADSSYAEVPAIDTTGYYISGVTENGTSAKVDTQTGAVAGEKVDHNNFDSHIIITLTKKPEVPVTPVTVDGDVVYIDDTTGNTIQSANLSGEVGSKINYTTQDKIKNYEGQGYELVSNNFNDGNETFAKDGNHFEVHLKHGTKEVTPKDPDPDHGFTKESLTKTGTQTVTYVGAGTQTPSENTTHVEFEHTLVIDKVNGKVVKDNGWSIAGNNYKSVVTPEVKGYTPDKTQAGGVQVTVDPKTGEGEINKNYVVTYTKNPETPVIPETTQGKVTYIDDTTGKTLDIDRFNGHVGDKINYTTKDKIKSYQSQGYEIVSNNFNDGHESFAKDGNNFEVHLKHGTKEVTPKDPDPDHGYTKDNLTKIGTQTVIYTGAGDNTPASNTTHVEFEHTLVIDKVNGKIVKDNGWTPAKQTYTQISTPQVKGYTPDKTVVGGETVNVNGQINKTYIVTYSQNKPVEPNKPQPTKPTEPTNNQPSTPDPAPVLPENPTPSTPTNSETVIPHGQDVPEEPENNNDHEETAAPHASDIPETMESHQQSSVSPKAAANMVRNNSSSESSEETLPQTGEENDLDQAAAALGLTAASIGLLGLAGVRKRRHN